MYQISPSNWIFFMFMLMIIMLLKIHKNIKKMSFYKKSMKYKS